MSPSIRIAERRSGHTANRIRGVTNTRCARNKRIAARVDASDIVQEALVEATRQMDVFVQVTRDGGATFDYLETGREKDACWPGLASALQLSTAMSAQMES